MNGTQEAWVIIICVLIAGTTLSSIFQSWAKRAKYVYQQEDREKNDREQLP